MPVLTPLETPPLPSHLSLSPDSLPLHPSLPSKSLSFFFSFVFIINQIWGPGVLAIPIVFQQSGVVLTLATMVVFMVVSALSSTLLSQAIALIPGNCHYERRFEFSSALQYYGGHRTFVVCSVLLNITIQSYTLASIVICAQSIDQALVEITGKTFALILYPHVAFTSLDSAAFEALTSGSFALAVTLGYVVIVVLFLPTCFQSLDDNVKTVQLLSFLCFLAILIEFGVYFVMLGMKPAREGGGFHPVPALGSTYTQLISVFIFSWSYTMFIPSWLNEKKDAVSVNAVIWSSGFAALLGYAGFGLLCAAVEVGIHLDNILPILTDTAPVVTRIFAHAFALTIIAPGIPICAVSTRQNLLSAKVVGVRWAYFLSAVAPFLLSFLFSSGAFFANLLVWSSLLFNGVVNFIIPHALYLQAVRRWEQRRRKKRKQQREHAETPSDGVHVFHSSTHYQPHEKEDDAVDGEAEEEEQREDSEEVDSLEEDPAVLEEEEDASDGVEDDDDDALSSSSPQVTPVGSLNAGSSTSLTLAASLLGGEGLQPSHSFHLPTSRSRHHPVYPFGRRRWLNRWAVQLTWTSMIATSVLIVGQIVCDLYYLLGKGENLLSG